MARMVRECGCGREAPARIIFGPGERVRYCGVLIDCSHCDRRTCDVCGMPDPTGKRTVCGSCGAHYPALVKNAFAPLGDLPWE